MRYVSVILEAIAGREMPQRLTLVLRLSYALEHIVQARRRVMVARDHDPGWESVEHEVELVVVLVDVALHQREYQQ